MPKKASTKKTTIKKTATKKTPRKSSIRRAKVAKKQRYAGYIVSTLLAAAFLFGIGYYMGAKEERTQMAANSVKGEIGAAFDALKVPDTVTMEYDEAGFGGLGMIERLQQKQAERKKRKAAEEARKKQAAEATQQVKTRLATGKRPKLVIIIDDVSHASQIKRIKALGYPVTPSIFPPSELSRNSHKISRGLRHFMIHLPMQSGSPKMNKMKGMLWTTDSDKKLRARAKQIRRFFPNGKFINNHTGSVFTSNYRAMKKMYRYLRNEGFVFVDSRTAGSSKVKRIAREFRDRYIVRDVFIDNTQTVPAIHKQLRRAVAIAKKRGYAVAIGHPHRATMKALAQSKSLFRGVDLVYIDDLYR